MLKTLRAELIKYRRNPIWLIFLILPVFPALLGTFNYLGNIAVLDQEWFSLWSQHTIFASTFFLPAQLGVFCSWQWRLEHTDHNWNAVMSAPVSVSSIYFSKFFCDIAASLLSQFSILVLFIISGKLAGISSPLPPDIFSWFVFGSLGSLCVCAVQLFFSLIIRSFAIPVAIALLGGIAGLLMTSQGVGLLCPYSLLCLGMRANNPLRELPTIPFLLSCLGFITLFSFLSVRYLKKHDVTTA